jgi:peptidoglycan-N-acetylglucosamine deacetylase
MGWHGLVLGAILAMPGWWPAGLAALALNHVLLFLPVMLPQSQLLGRTMTRLPGQGARVALTFDDGPDPEVTPLILDVLERHGARATFFCIGTAAARQPALMREIRRRGHLIGNHTMHHPRAFAALGVGGQLREWTEAAAVLAATGPVSRHARAPLGFRSPLSDLALHRAGLRHAAWSQRGLDTRCTDPATVLRRLTATLVPGDILLLHDGNTARTPEGRPVSVVVLESLLPWLATRGLACVTLDDSSAATPASAGATQSPTPT